MAALMKVVRISKAINNVTKLLTNLSVSAKNHNFTASPSICQIQRLGNPVAAFHTTQRYSDLMEFFDDEKNWAKQEVKSGRSWKLDELRLKSNEDLHKLWFVLLKERNMLLTMEEQCKKAFQLFPSPERIDKIADSMENLEKVVRERNRAYHLLETGELGERPKKRVYSQIGLKFTYRMRQYDVPKFVNSKWHSTHKFGFGGHAVRKFKLLYNEKLWLKKRKLISQEHRHACILLRRFPNLDMEALKAKFPNVDMEKVKRSRIARGHSAPK